MKSCSTSVIVMEMQIKTMRYHLTPIRMAIIQKTRNNNCWWGCGKKEAFVHCSWECINKLMQPWQKTIRKFLQKLKIELPYDSAIPFLGTYSNKAETLIRKDVCTLHSLHHYLQLAKIYKQPKFPSTDKWIKKLWYIYTYREVYIMKHYLATRKNEILQFVTPWMELEGNMLSEIRPRKTNTIWFCLWVKNKKMKGQT